MTDTTDIARAAKGWWVSHLNDMGQGRMARAQLRRCATPAEALTLPATHALHTALGGRLRGRSDTLALIAIALANLREDAPQTAATRMGDTLSALRFQNLIRTSNPAELIRPLCRALHQIDSRANVGRMARDLYWWRDDTRSSWCFDYYGAGFADPANTETSLTETSR